jgi:hypothetical protein
MKPGEIVDNTAYQEAVRGFFGAEDQGNAQDHLVSLQRSLGLEPVEDPRTLKVLKEALCRQYGIEFDTQDMLWNWGGPDSEIVEYAMRSFCEKTRGRTDIIQIVADIHHRAQAQAAS